MQSTEATHGSRARSGSGPHDTVGPDIATDTSRLWAGAAVSVPLLVLASAAIGLLEKAPGHVATRWSTIAGSGPDAFGTPGDFLVEVGALTLVCTVISLLAIALVRDARATANILVFTTAVAAVSTAVWVTSVVLSMTTDDIETLSVESGAPPIVASMLWAAVPFVIMRARASRPAVSTV
ncbi:hypothetical protein [Curtobacterium sp. Leaf261]|uniref:hypothetical protein n=1 Tax=Curtobacterium sp. Leaf261 TaxID=1736311 RepID=UPI000700EF9C|nr:hypothetical protein [Curtobacterium sp. Leaf261]KQO65215.1 hypothetical protein ASF23_03655 [Curtobacterium sp. Leaf261]